MSYIDSLNSRQGIDAMADSRQKAHPSDRPPHDAERGTGMRIAPWYLAALAPFAAIGYSGAHLGHALVVLLTMGIFLGTISLRRSQPGAAPGIED